MATDSIYYIHKHGDIIPGSIHVIEDLYWGGDFEIIKREISSGTFQPDDIRFFLGYSGWDAGQLENEIKEDSWLVTGVNQEIIMKELNIDSWFDFVKKAGSRYSVWKNFPQHPSLN